MVSYHNTRRVDKNIYKSINLSRAAFDSGLGLACQAKDHSYHTKISTLAKAFTENPE